MSICSSGLDAPCYGQPVTVEVDGPAGAFEQKAIAQFLFYVQYIAHMGYDMKWLRYKTTIEKRVRLHSLPIVCNRFWGLK